MSTEKARGKGASQAPFKTQPKGENLHIVASCRGAEIFSFLGWQDGLQDFLSDVALSWLSENFIVSYEPMKLTEYSAERGRRNF